MDIGLNIGLSAGLIYLFLVVALSIWMYKLAGKGNKLFFYFLALLIPLVALLVSLFALLAGTISPVIFVLVCLAFAWKILVAFTLYSAASEDRTAWYVAILLFELLLIIYWMVDN